MIPIMIVMAALFLMAFAVLFMVLKKTQAGDPDPAEILSPECLLERYRPMFRLLDESDCEFIASGFPGGSELRRFRAERRSLFRIYLRDLGVDHSRIVDGIRDLLIRSQLDRPDLAKALYRCQWRFASAMISVESKLLLHVLGIGTVDVRSLVAAVECLQTQLQGLGFVQAVA